MNIILREKKVMEQNLTDKEVYNKNFASFYNYVLTEQAREYGIYFKLC